MCTCCPIQATAIKLLITEAKYCEEQRSRYGQHTPVQLTEALRRHSQCDTNNSVLFQQKRDAAYLPCSTVRGCCSKWSRKATAAKDIFIWSIITRYGCSICHSAVDSVALKHSLTPFPGALLQITTEVPFSRVLLIIY